jgi:hypothetical protein
MTRPSCARILVRASETKPPDPEVPERSAGRRQYSAKYKAKILAEYEGLEDKGARGALLRREGLYVLTASEQKDLDRGHGWGIPTSDYLPTGRLVIMSEHGGYSTTTLAADRKRWTLEEKLPHAFLKLEEKAAKDDERRRPKARSQILGQS